MERLSLKKVRLSINIAIVGMEGSGKKLFTQYLDRIAFPFRLNGNIREYLVLQEEIPFIIRVLTVEHLDHLTEEKSGLNNLDTLIICLDIYDTQSINQFTSNHINDFISKYHFQGLTFLVAVDSYYIEKGVPSEYFRINRFNLIKKTNQLNFIYCFEIQNKNGDIKEVIDQILKDVILRFQSSKSELFEQAKKYGHELSSEPKSNQNC